MTVSWSHVFTFVFGFLAGASYLALEESGKLKESKWRKTSYVLALIIGIVGAMASPWFVPS